jgi:cholesterol transport system auxiliary component
MKRILVLLLVLLLSGCSIFGPAKTGRDNTYVISAINSNCLHSYPTKLTLLVDTPEAMEAFNTAQMAYSRCPFELRYFSKSAWADTPPNMLLPLIVQSLQNTCHFHAVVAAPFSDHYDLLLNTQIIKLQQDFACCPSRVHIILRAQLINESTGNVMAARQFCVTAAAPCDNPYGGVIATNRATTFLLNELTCFVLQATSNM